MDMIVDAITGEVKNVGALPDVTEVMVREEGARRLREIAALYTREERETWGEQISQANAVQEGAVDGTPLLDGIALGRGVSRGEMATIILGKADAFSSASGVILGAQQSLVAMSPIPQDYDDDKYWT